MPGRRTRCRQHKGPLPSPKIILSAETPLQLRATTGRPLPRNNREAALDAYSSSGEDERPHLKHERRIGSGCCPGYRSLACVKIVCVELDRLRAPPIGLRCDTATGQRLARIVANSELALCTATTPTPPQVPPTSTPVLNHNAIRRGRGRGVERAKDKAQNREGTGNWCQGWEERLRQSGSDCVWPLRLGCWFFCLLSFPVIGAGS